MCQLDSVQGMADALGSVRWKRHHLFLVYEYAAEGRPRFGLSLGLFVDCLNAFSAPGNFAMIEIRYPGPDMQLLLKSVDFLDAFTYAEIRTRVPDTISWDYRFEPTGDVPVTFTSSILKEVIDDLEWPGSSIQIRIQPDPVSVTLKAEGHGDLQVDFEYFANNDLLVAFQCDQTLSYRYKYKFLRATTSNLPSSVLRDNRGSKLTIGRGGLLKIQHLVSVLRAGGHHPFIDPQQQPSRIAYIEFFVKPEEEDEAPINDT